MSEKTSDVGYIRLSQISGDALDPASIQRGINNAMSGVIADATRGQSNPQKLDPPEKVVPLDAVRVVEAGEKAAEDRGWYTPKPLAEGSRRTDEIIEKLVDAFEPHGEASVLRRGKEE